MAKHVANLRGGRAGQLTLSTSPALATLVMPDVIRRFRERWPTVAVVMRTRPTQETVELVAEQRADIGVIVGASADPRTEMRVLWREPVGCLLPPLHPLAGETRLTLADLAPYPIITLSSDQPVGATLRRVMQEAQSDVKIDVEASQSTSVCELVRAGVGVGVLDGLGLKVGAQMGLAVLPLSPSMELETGIVLARHRAHSRFTLDCVTMLEEAALSHSV